MRASTTTPSDHIDAIQPSKVRLLAAMLFLAYAQKGVDRALYKKQDLVEWFEQTLKIFEPCRTLKHFFNCFHDDIADFKELSVLLKDLDTHSDKLLKGVDVFQLLEQLKQDAGDIIFQEISRIFSVNQAENAKRLRLNKEEKADIQEKCQALMKMAGMSPANNSLQAEMAAAAWRYLMNNLPSLFNNLSVVKNAIPLWQKPELNLSESLWIKQFVSLLDQPGSTYSSLPDHIKKGLKIYLTSHKKSTDYAEYVKLQNSLIGRPNLTQLENGGRKILRIHGGYLSLSGVLSLPELTSLKGIDEIQILATETLFLDESMNDVRFRGMNIVMSGKTIEVSTSVTLNTSGLDAIPHANRHARDGRSFSYSSSGSGCNGEDGKPGNPGGSAGHIHIQAADIKGVEKLHIIANGGNGSDGQHGGNGDRGRDGQDGNDADYYSDRWIHHATNQYHIRFGTNGVTGQSGGNGGAAGGGGQGGHAGLVVVRDERQNYVSCNKISIAAKPGQDGVAGEPGQGGEAGLDGRHGLASGVVHTGAFTLQPDQYLKGWRLKAWLKKGGWFTKNVWHLDAEVSESQVKSRSRSRTRHHGQVGARAHCKQAAPQKAAVHFSDILHQCPTLAHCLSLNEAAKTNATHQQINHSLAALFVLGDRHHALESGIQHLEKEQATLSQNLKKLEESARCITNNAIHQRMTEHHQVTQLAYPTHSPLSSDEQSDTPADLRFFHKPRTLEGQENHTDALLFDRLMTIIFKNKEDARLTEQIGEWQAATARFNNRLEKDIKKISAIDSNHPITEKEVMASLEIMAEALSEKRALSAEDVTNHLYDLSVWHAYEPHFVEDVLRQEIGLFEAALMQPQQLAENGYRRLKFVLAFMRLLPTQLDELCRHSEKDRNMQDLLDRHYRECFYQPRKEKVLSQQAQLTFAAKQRLNALIENILFETKRARSGAGYAESVMILDTLIHEMDQTNNELPERLASLFELLERCRLMSEKNATKATPVDELFSHKKENNPDKHSHATDTTFNNLSDIPFPSSLYAPGSTGYAKLKKDLSDFIEAHRANPVWIAIFERVGKKMATTDVLPSLEEISLLFSMMMLREASSTLLLDLDADDIACWSSAVLLGNTREKLHRFLIIKASEDSTNAFEELDQKVTMLARHQPTILNLFYQKLSSEVALFDPKLVVTLNDLSDILSALGNLKQGCHDRPFLSALRETPLPGWNRVLREHALNLALFAHSSSRRKNRTDKKRCLSLLCKLEESLGKQKIDRLVVCIQKAGASVDDEALANLLMQLRYEQLTLDNDSLALLEQTAFKQWAAVLSDYHKKENQKPRDLQALLHIMQNDAGNKQIDSLFSKNDSPPAIVHQINDIHAHLAETQHELTRLLFQCDEQEKKSAPFSTKAIHTWTTKDILAWSDAFRKQPDGRKLVEQHLAEIIAVISQAVFLEKGFYPRDVQYLALLTAFDGSDHAQKMISQIATGQGKTMTGTMLALLRVFAGERVDFVTSSSVLAEETEEEIRSIARMFGVTSACNIESNEGPYFLERIDGEPTPAQKEMLCRKKGAAIIKKDGRYALGLARPHDGVFFERPLDLSKWPDFRKKITDHPFEARKCFTSDGLHEDVLKIIRDEGLQSYIQTSLDDTQKLADSYRCDILCGDLQSFMRAHLLTEFYGKNITQNRKAFAIMDEVDRLLDEMRDILYLSHDIPDMHHLNNLLVAIWEGVHHASCAEETEENIAGLTAYFLNKLSPGHCSTAHLMAGQILIPAHLEAFVRRRLSTWVRSAYIAKNGLSRDGEYIVAQMGEEEGKGVYLVDQDTGVTSRNKELANGVHQFLRLKHQDWPKPLSLKAIYCDPVSFLLENYKNGFFGMTGTQGSEQDRVYFEKLFSISKMCVIPRHELLNLEVKPPILVSSFREQMGVVAKIVQDKAILSRQPVEIICDTIADAKAMTAYLKATLPEVPLYTRIHSFESFSKGSRNDPIRLGDVIITTAISGRGTDFHLDKEAERKGLCLVKLGVSKHERADRQVDGRTARKGLPGTLIHVLCPTHGETSLEAMQAARDLHQEQLLDQIRKTDLHENRINRQLFEVFSQLAREVETIIRNTEPGNEPWAEGYVERQMAALRTHWALWLDEAEQKMDNAALRNADALYADFQIFRKRILATAKENGPIKLVTGASEITQLGIWLGVEKGAATLSLECFDKVIQDFYPFSGQALYYKAFILLTTAKPDDFDARKKAAHYLKRARTLLKKELERLHEPVDRMVAIDSHCRKTGQGLNDSQLKKTVNGIAQALMIHLSAIDLLIGAVTDPLFFQSDSIDKESAKVLFSQLVEAGDIKGYHISRKVSVTPDKRLEIILTNGYRREIEFPSEFSEYKDKIIDMISIRQTGDKAFRTLSYESYCKLVFGEEEVAAEDTKKMAMRLSWHFLQQENIISQPGLNRSRRDKLSLNKNHHSNQFSESAWIRAGGLLRILDEIQMHTDGLQNLSERGRIPMEVLSFFKHTLEFDGVIRVEKKPVRWNWGATLVLFWAAAQIAAGILLACPALVQQGVGDMVFLAMSAIRGDFSMENYLRHKLMAVSTAALTIAGKKVAGWVLKSAEKYIIGQDATHLANLTAQSASESLPQAVISSTTNSALSQQGLLARATQRGVSFFSFARKVVDNIPAPVLVQHTDLSFLSQFGSAVKETLNQVATQATMQYLLTTFSANDVDKHVRETIGSKLQIGLDSVTAEVKRIAMEILEYSESSEQAENILQSIFENTLREHQLERQSPLNIGISLLSTPDMGHIFGDEIAALTGIKVLGNLSRFVIANLDKIGAIEEAINGAKSRMDEVKQNLIRQLDKLKSTRARGKRSESQVAAFSKFLDEEIQRFKCHVGNASLNAMRNTVLTPVVRWAFDSVIDFVAKDKTDANIDVHDKEEEIHENSDDDDLDVDGDEIESTYVASEARFFLMNGSKQNGEKRSLEAIERELKEKEKILLRSVNYKKLLAFHRKDSVIDSEDLMNSMGGRVKINSAYNGGAFNNTCTIRMSKALNDTGYRVPYIQGKTVSYYNEKGEKCWAFYRVRDLSAYLRKTWGEPITITPDNTSHYPNVKGIAFVIFPKGPSVPLWATAHTVDGHATFFDSKKGASRVEHYEPEYDTLLIFPLPTKKLVKEYMKLHEDYTKLKVEEKLASSNVVT